MSYQNSNAFISNFYKGFYETPIQKWSATPCSEKLALWLLKGVLLFVKLELRVGTGKRAGKLELDGTWRSQRWRYSRKVGGAGERSDKAPRTWSEYLHLERAAPKCSARQSSLFLPVQTLKAHWWRRYIFFSKEDFVRRLASKNFSGSMVQTVLNLFNKFIGNFVDVRPLRYKLAHESIGVLIQPSLPSNSVIWQGKNSDFLAWD